MPFQSATAREFYLVRWDRPEGNDVEHVMRECRELHKRRDAKIVYFAIVPPDGEPPEGEARSALVRSFKDLIAMSEAVHLVLEGEGFKQSIKRSVMAGILLASGKRGHVFVHSTLEEAVAQLDGPRRDAVRALAKTLERRTA